ncbi:MAG: hypothetical protein EA395_05450, partial [Phormidium sp. GEM2.Bin31]
MVVAQKAPQFRNFQGIVVGGGGKTTESQRTQRRRERKKKRREGRGVKGGFCLLPFAYCLFPQPLIPLFRIIEMTLFS